MRGILHVDMDAYFAAVEQRDNPTLRGKPVIIGGLPNTRGVVSTCSYEARRYGVHSAMSLTEAYRRCPHAIFMQGNHVKYKEISQHLRTIFYRFTPIIEPISIDEAFLDVTGCESLFGPLEVIALKVKEAIKEETNLIASVGAAPNKFLAKIASDLDKPDGLVIVKPNEIESFLRPLPIKRLWGVGAKTAERLHRLGFHTVGDIAQVNPQLLENHFGKAGRQLYNLAHGRDERPVLPSEEIKSISHEHTFTYDTGAPDEIRATLLLLAEKVARRLRQAKLQGRTLTLKVRFSDFNTITRSITLYQATDLEKDIFSAVLQLLDQVQLRKPLRLIGVGISNLLNTGENRQITLFEDQYVKDRQLAKAIDTIKDRFGDKVITYGGSKLRIKD